VGDSRDPNKASFRLKPGLILKVDEMASKRGVSRSVILNEAVAEYIERKENPETLRYQIRETLQEYPDLLDEPLRKLAARELTKK
jgi:predicted DNA-binding protein